MANSKWVGGVEAQNLTDWKISQNSQIPGMDLLREIVDTTQRSTMFQDSRLTAFVQNPFSKNNTQTSLSFITSTSTTVLRKRAGSLTKISLMHPPVSKPVVTLPAFGFQTKPSFPLKIFSKQWISTTQKLRRPYEASSGPEDEETCRLYLTS
jgi:hypothetical protein